MLRDEAIALTGKAKRERLESLAQYLKNKGRIKSYEEIRNEIMEEARKERRKVEVEIVSIRSRLSLEFYDVLVLLQGLYPDNCYELIECTTDFSHYTTADGFDEVCVVFEW